MAVAGAQRRPRRRKSWIYWGLVVMVLLVVGAGRYWYSKEHVRLQRQVLTKVQGQGTFTDTWRQEELETQSAPTLSQAEDEPELIDFEQRDYQRKIRLRIVAGSLVAQKGSIAVFYRTDAQGDPNMAMRVVDERTITRGIQAIERYSAFEGKKKISAGEKQAARQSALDDEVLAQSARANISMSEDVTADINSRFADLRQSIADEARFQAWAKAQYGSTEGLRKNITDDVLTQRYLAFRGMSREALLAEAYDTLEVLWKVGDRE